MAIHTFRLDAQTPQHGVGADDLRYVMVDRTRVGIFCQECDLDQIRLVMAHARTALFGKVRIAYEMKDGRTLSIVP